MQVILTQSVQGVGKAGEEHKVADGYARNYLIPRKMAVEATKGNLRNLEKIREDALKREAESRAAAEKVLAAIDGQRINIAARVSPDGSKLYGSITTQDIADRLKAATGQEIDKRSVLTDAIKIVSINPIPVRVYAGMTAQITVVVHPEGQKPPTELTPQPEVVEVAPAPAPVVEEQEVAPEPVPTASEEAAYDD